MNKFQCSEKYCKKAKLANIFLNKRKNSPKIQRTTKRLSSALREK